MKLTHPTGARARWLRWTRSEILAVGGTTAPVSSVVRLALGRDLAAGRMPEVSAWIDGAMPFRAETSRGYVTQLASQYGQQLVIARTGIPGQSNPAGNRCRDESIGRGRRLVRDRRIVPIDLEDRGGGVLLANRQKIQTPV